MIIEHAPDGRITHIRHDPLPPGIDDFLALKGIDHIRVSGPLPDDVFRTMRVIDGVLVARPECPAIVDVTGRTIALSGLPEGSTVSVAIEGEVIEIEGQSIEVDEAGPLTLIITPPWPYMEARYDLEIE